MKRRILILTTVLLLAAGFSAARPALAHAEGDNVAIAVNTKDGSSVFKLSFAIRHVMSDVVDTTNAAVAYSSCTDCSTVAIAIEIVLIQSDASVISPTNIALAINQSCTLCVTVADALQFVLTTGGPVHFDAEGNRILAEIRKRLHDLKHQELTLDQLQAEVQAIRQQIRDVLANHLVPAGKPDSPEPKPVTTTTESTPTATTTTTTESPPTTTRTPTTTDTTPTTTTSGTTTAP